MSVFESDPRIQTEKKNYLFLYPQYSFVSDPFSSLQTNMSVANMSSSMFSMLF
jgi:hypothetical protein